MAWFRVDDSLADHPKVLRISLTALGLWTKAGAWCAKHLTDGKIPNAAITLLGGNDKLARELVGAELWLEEGNDGYSFHQWAERQPSKAEVIERLEQQRARMQRVRAHKQSTNGSTNGARAHAQQALVRITPSHPIPSHPEEREIPHCVGALSAHAHGISAISTRIRTGYEARHAAQLGVAPAQTHKLAESIASVSSWVADTAKRRNADALVLADQLLDGLFRSARAAAKRFPLTWVAQDPLEFLAPQNGAQQPMRSAAQRELDAAVAEADAAALQHLTASWDDPELAPHRDRVARARQAVDREQGRST